MLTSAGRSRRMSESTALGVGSMMSMSRLCVRISKCSRLSLSLSGRPNNNEYVLLGRQRHRAHDRGASTLYGVHDLARGAVDDLVVIRLEPDADLLSRHAVLPLLVQIRRRSPHSGVSQPLCARSLALDRRLVQRSWAYCPIHTRWHAWTTPEMLRQPCHSVRVPPASTNPEGVLACETTDRLAWIMTQAALNSPDLHQETTIPRTRACRKVRSVTSLLHTPISAPLPRPWPRARRVGAAPSDECTRTRPCHPRRACESVKRVWGTDSVDAPHARERSTETQSASVALLANRNCASAAKSIPSPPTSAPLKPVLASVRDVEGVFVVFFVGSVGVVGPTGAAFVLHGVRDTLTESSHPQAQSSAHQST